MSRTRMTTLLFLILELSPFVILPTYEVCGGIMFSLFRSSVRTYVRLFVCSFVRLSVTGSKFLC